MIRSPYPSRVVRRHTRLLASREESLGQYWVGTAIHHGLKGCADQVAHLACAGSGHDPGVGGDAGVGRLDPLHVGEVVVLVHAVDEDDTGLRVVVGGVHDLLPEIARLDGAVDPHAVVAAVRAGLEEIRRRLPLVDELPVAVGFHRPHERVGHRHAHVEVLEVAVVLGVDEVLQVRVVAAQDAHLRAAARACRFHRFARAVEHPHVRHRAARAAVGALHVRAPGADGREVVADATAPAHGFGGLHQGDVDARAAVDGFGDRVAHGLHEAVDQRGPEVGARGGVDASARDEAAVERLEEHGLPAGGVLFDRRQRARHAPPHVVDGALVALGVFFQQHVEGDLLGEDSEIAFVWFHVRYVAVTKAKSGEGNPTPSKRTGRASSLRPANQGVGAIYCAIDRLPARHMVAEAGKVIHWARGRLPTGRWDPAPVATVLEREPNPGGSSLREPAPRFRAALPGR